MFCRRCLAAAYQTVCKHTCGVKALGSKEKQARRKGGGGAERNLLAALETVDFYLGAQFRFLQWFPHTLASLSAMVATYTLAFH
jgi:hypothetical protein